MKTEFESRIDFKKLKNQGMPESKSVSYYANLTWNGKLYETTKYTKEFCIADLKNKAGIN
jgi:hypothetical protein